MRLAAAFALAFVAACKLDSSGVGTDDPFIEGPRDSGAADAMIDTSIDDTTGDVTVETGPTVAEVCDYGIRAYCAKYFSCAPFSGRVVWGDEETCRAHMRPQCLVTLAAPGISYGTGEYLACMQKHETAACEAFFMGTVCEFPVGTLAKGAGCAYHAQCSSGFCELGDGLCGKCADPLGEGAPCTRSCPLGMACVGSPKKCAKYRPRSALCAPDAPCAQPLVCAAGVCTDGATSGACDPTGAAGNPCSGHKGYYCPTSLTCTAYVVVKAGEVCGYPDPYRYCSVGSLCNASVGGTCIAPAADMAACNTANSIGCVSPSTCVDGFCKQRDPTECK